MPVTSFRLNEIFGGPRTALKSNGHSDAAPRATNNLASGHCKPCSSHKGPFSGLTQRSQVGGIGQELAGPLCDDGQAHASLVGKYFNAFRRVDRRMLQTLKCRHVRTLFCRLYASGCGMIRARSADTESG
jgi:hypothetical protein